MMSRWAVPCSAVKARTILKLFGLVAAPLVGLFVAMASYGAERWSIAMGGLHTDTLKVASRYLGGEQLHAAGTVLHPYASDLVGVFGFFVLVGLFAAWVVASIALTPARRPLYKGRHVKVS